MGKDHGGLIARSSLVYDFDAIKDFMRHYHLDKIIVAFINTSFSALYIERDKRTIQIKFKLTPSPKKCN